jgi:hypothetical protein
MGGVRRAIDRRATAGSCASPIGMFASGGGVIRMQARTVRVSPSTVPVCARAEWRAPEGSRTGGHGQRARRCWVVYGPLRTVRIRPSAFPVNAFHAWRAPLGPLAHTHGPFAAAHVCRQTHANTPSFPARPAPCPPTPHFGVILPLFTLASDLPQPLALARCFTLL